MLMPPAVQYASNLPNLVVKGLRLIKARYSPQNTPVGASRLLLSNPSSLMHQVEKHKISQKPKDALWWAVTPLMGSELVVVRNRVRRRVTVAIKEVLKDKGYDINGQPILGNDKALKGSLEVQLLGKDKVALLTVKLDQLKKEAGLLITELEWQTKRNAQQQPVRRDPVVSQSTTKQTAGQDGRKPMQKGRSVILDKSRKLKSPTLQRLQFERQNISPAPSSAKPQSQSPKPAAPAVSSKANVPPVASSVASKSLDFKPAPGSPKLSMFKPAAKPVSPKAQNTKPAKASEPHKDYIPYRDLLSPKSPPD